MHIAVFSAKPHDRRFLEAANTGGEHRLSLFDARLSVETAPVASSAEAVCAFVNDDLGRDVIERLATSGVRLIALRSAGFNQVDLRAAKAANIVVARW